MRYIALLLVAGSVCFFIAKRPAIAPVPAAAVQPAAPGTDFLKAPIDRTHEVLAQAHVRADDPDLR
jgi:hypothetical protein